jgi:GxxExxY protein
MPRPSCGQEDEGQEYASTITFIHIPALSIFLSKKGFHPVPVIVDAEIQQLPYDIASRVAYDVMHCVFAAHNEFGRFMDEHIYRDEIAARVPGIRTEVLIEVMFRDFRKPYFMDLLVQGGFVFELKTVEKLVHRHRSQLLNYLLLTELRHGKLVNVRSELVEHEFVNTRLTHRDRTAFSIRDADWREPETDLEDVKGLVIEMLRDWGVGLDLHLYEDALTHFLGGKERVVADIDIVGDGRTVGRQKVRLLGPGTAFKITALGADGMTRFEDHARRFLQHTRLKAIHWINLARDYVSFRTLERERTGR